MLIQRVITAVTLLVPLLALVWFAPTPWVYAVFCAVGLGIAWEWTALMGVQGRGARAGYLVLTGVALAAAWLLREAWMWFALVSFVWWVAALWLVKGYPEVFEKRPGLGFMAVLGQVLLVPTLISLAALHAMQDGALRVLFAFFLVFVADVGAYFAGRSLGRRKLAPQVSPGKTIEGAIGGIILCGLWAAVAGPYAYGITGAEVVALFVLVSLVAAAFSIVGDLTESMFKRISGVKDSGTLLPGHGGLLDRVDSIVAAVPILALGVYVLEL